MQTYTARKAGSDEQFTIVFDVGGVLLDWNPLYLYTPLLGSAEAAKAFLEEIGFNSWNLENDRGRTVAEGARVLSAQFPQYAQLIHAYDLEYDKALNGADEAVVAIMQALKDAGWRLWCLSNFPADKYAQVRRDYPFYQLFEGVVISGEVGLAKPDPTIFELLLTKLRRPAQQCLLIDDNAENIKAAHKLGFETIWFHSAEQLAEDLRARGILTNAS